MFFFSLGFSCQSRFSLDAACAEGRRFPFDFNISTKGAVLSGLETAGESFLNTTDSLSVYAMTTDRREGITNGKGLFFWHDYPCLPDSRIEPNWRARCDGINAKYTTLWARFINLLRDPQEKVFLVSNTQVNLDQFCPAEDFGRHFGLDAGFLEKLSLALGGLGCSNYRFIFLCRSIHESLKLRQSGARAMVRFGGRIRLPASNAMAQALVHQVSSAREPSIEAICWQYERGIDIVPSSGGVALAYRDGSPWAEVSPYPGGFLFVFAEGTNRIFRACLDEGGAIRFENRSLWRRARRWPTGGHARTLGPRQEWLSV